MVGGPTLRFYLLRQMISTLLCLFSSPVLFDSKPTWLSPNTPGSLSVPYCSQFQRATRKPMQCVFDQLCVFPCCVCRKLQRLTDAEGCSNLEPDIRAWFPVPSYKAAVLPKCCKIFRNISPQLCLDVLHWRYAMLPFLGQELR